MHAILYTADLFFVVVNVILLRMGNYVTLLYCISNFHSSSFEVQIQKNSLNDSPYVYGTCIHRFCIKES